jgi:ABC-type tungstate transport system permease subunit
VSHVALLEGVAIRTVYAWRDHFVLVGPRSNPANLDITTNKDIYTLFIDFYKAAEAANSTPPVRFLSRCDKSATNIKESEIWISIGQVRRCFPSSWSGRSLTYRYPADSVGDGQLDMVSSIHRPPDAGSE